MASLPTQRSNRQAGSIRRYVGNADDRHIRVEHVCLSIGIAAPPIDGGLWVASGGGAAYRFSTTIDAL